MWIVFDWVVDPHNFQTFLTLRISCILAILFGLVAFLKVKEPERHSLKFEMLMYLSLAGSILPMCLITDVKIPYFTGLSAVFYGASILFIWPMRYFLIPMGVTLSVIVIYGYLNIDQLNSFMIGGYLTFNVVVTATLANWLTYRQHQKNGSLLQALENLSNIDGLTGIANRRSFDRRLRDEFSRMNRNKSTIALLMIDIDFFKQYNDHYMHQKGDDCLRQVANSLSAAICREADFAARYGGEEFAIVLPDLDIEGAKIVAQRVIDGLKKLNIPHAKSPVAPFVTVSIGVACGDAKATSQLVELADLALYKAKQEGRNKFLVG